MNNTVPTSALRVPAVNRAFGTTLGVSLGIHLAVLIGYAWWDASQLAVIDLPDEAPIRAIPVRLGKPRDKKLLPRLDTAPKPAPQDKAVAVPTLDKKATAAAEKEDSKEKMKSAMERIREMEEQENAKQQAMARIAERVGKASEEDEPEGQEDGSPQGEAVAPSMINAYLGSVGIKVKQHYLVPSVIQPHQCARLVATVMVRIGQDGSVLEVHMHKDSGNDLFDSAVLAAVKSASPLPAPPPNMRKLVSDGFGFKFRCDR